MPPKKSNITSKKRKDVLSDAKDDKEADHAVKKPKKNNQHKSDHENEE